MMESLCMILFICIGPHFIVSIHIFSEKNWSLGWRKASLELVNNKSIRDLGRLWNRGSPWYALWLLWHYPEKSDTNGEIFDYLLGWSVAILWRYTWKFAVSLYNVVQHWSSMNSALLDNSTTFFVIDDYDFQWYFEYFDVYQKLDPKNGCRTRKEYAD